MNIYDENDLHDYIIEQIKSKITDDIPEDSRVEYTKKLWKSIVRTDEFSKLFYDTLGYHDEDYYEQVKNLEGEEKKKELRRLKVYEFLIDSRGGQYQTATTFIEDRDMKLIWNK